MLLDLLKTRNSVRHFKDADISNEVIDYILEAGRLSPSGGNEQSWMFGVIDDIDIIKEILEIAYNQKWIISAKFLIILCTKIVQQEAGGRDIQLARYPNLSAEIISMDDEIYSRLNLEEHQTKIPGTHMVLAALEKGVGSTWISYFDVDRLSKLIKLPNGFIASEIIVFGFPLKEQESVRKKSLEDITFYNKFSTKK